MHAMRSITVCCALALPVSADTLIVDHAGGVGTDYLTISEAVAVAEVGDRILVQVGTYDESVVLTQGLVLLGVGVPTVLGGITIEDLPYLQEVRVCGFAIRAEGGTFGGFVLEGAAVQVEDCDGAVLLHDLQLEGWMWTPFGLSVTGSRDVRGRELFAQGGIGSGYNAQNPWWWPGSAVHCLDSRFELVGCELRGGWSEDPEEEGDDGTPGLWLGSSAKVSLVDSLVVGAGGSDCVGSGLTLECFAGNGAPAVLVSAGASLWVAHSDLRGGLGGTAWCECPAWYDGVDADGLQVEPGASVVRSDRNHIEMHSGGPIPGANDRFRPVLLAGGPDAGSVSLTVLGLPGSACSLIYGRAPIVGTQPGISGLELVAPVRVDAVYVLDGAGRLDIDLPLPANLLPGDRFVAQAIVDDGLQRRYSNSLPVIVR